MGIQIVETVKWHFTQNKVDNILPTIECRCGRSVSSVIFADASVAVAGHRHEWKLFIGFRDTTHVMSSTYAHVTSVLFMIRKSNHWLLRRFFNLHAVFCIFQHFHEETLLILILQVTYLVLYVYCTTTAHGLRGPWCRKKGFKLNHSLTAPTTVLSLTTAHKLQNVEDILMKTKR